MIDQVLEFLVYGFGGLVPVVIFFILGFANIVLSVARFYRFFGIQQEKSLFSFAIKNLFQGVAFIIGSLVVSPHPVRDFSHLLPWGHLGWAISIPFFLVAVHLECMSLADAIRLRGSVDSGKNKLQEPHQNTATTGPTEQAAE